MKMDNKKRAQAAWAVLLALLALLFIPQLPNLPRNSNPSESPAEDPAPDESGEENSDPNEDGAEDTSPDGSDEGWFQDDPESVGDPDAPTGTPDSGGVAPAPEDGQGWEAPEDSGDGTGTGSGTFGDIIDELLDEYPSATAAPSWLAPVFDDQDGETTYGNDPYGNVEDYPTVVPDLREDPQSFEELGADLQNRISGAAAVLSLPAAQLHDELKDPVTDLADETVQWALDNPAQAVLVTGVAVAGGGALLVTASGTTAVSGAAASTLLGTGIITRSSVEAAESRIEDLTGQGDDSGTSAPSDEPWSPAPGDDPGDGDDVADVDDDTPTATPGSGGHEEIEEPEPDPVSAPSDDPWSPAPGDDAGDEDDIADPDSGEGGYLPGGFV